VERKFSVMESNVQWKTKQKKKLIKGKIFHCPKQRYFQKSEQVSVEFVCLKCNLHVRQENKIKQNTKHRNLPHHTSHGIISRPTRVRGCGYDAEEWILPS